MQDTRRCWLSRCAKRGGLAALGLLVATAVAAPVVVERVEVEPNLVRLHLSEPAVARGIALPPRKSGEVGRVIVDVDGATLDASAGQPLPGGGALLQVRPEQVRNAEQVRVTIELAERAGFVVENAGTKVTVRFTPYGEPAAAPPTQPAVDQPAASGTP